MRAFSFVCKLFGKSDSPIVENAKIFSIIELFYVVLYLNFNYTMDNKERKSMKEEIYTGTVLEAKKRAQNSLTLNSQPAGLDSSYGYSIADTVFLSERQAEDAKAYYFDAYDFLDAVHKGDTQRIENYKKQLRKQTSIVMANLMLGTDKDQKTMTYDNYWMPLFTELKDVWTDSSVKNRKVIIPLGLMFKGKAGHAAVACLNFRSQKNAADIIFLEQHAEKKGTPNYDEHFDYTDGLKLYQDFWCEVLQHDLGIKEVHTYKNDKPISHRKRCCGVIASEVRRRLLATNDPLASIESVVEEIPADMVDVLHKENQAKVIEYEEKTKQRRNLLSFLKNASQTKRMNMSVSHSAQSPQSVYD